MKAPRDKHGRRRLRTLATRRAKERSGAHWTDCKGKRRFRDEDQAKRAAAFIRRRVDYVRWYHCHVCNGFHLTMQEPR